MTLPMVLTFARLFVAVPTLYFLLSYEEPTWTWVGVTLLVFAALGATDYFDGFCSRRWGQTSRWGKVLDPIADKVFVIGTILVIVYLHKPPPVFFLLLGIIAFRELLVSGLREGFAGEFDLPVTWLAKWKTTLQMTMLGYLLVASTVGQMFHHALYEYVFSFLLPAILLGLAFFVTVRTGIDYLQAAVTNSMKHSADV